MNIITKIKFKWYAYKWHRETGFDSTSRRFNNINYQKIINLGKDVVPILLHEMSVKPDWWDYALREITGENPVPKENAGRLHRIAFDWVYWGIRKGYLREKT